MTPRTYRSGTDREIGEAQRTVGTTTGINAAPEGAATFAALAHLVASGFLTGGERIVLFNTGSGLKLSDAP